MNGADVEKAYRMSVKRERDRERKWRKSKRYGEIRNMVHFFDFEAAEAAEVSPSWLSDNGAGVERIIDACDREDNFYERRRKWGADHLRNHGHAAWLPVYHLATKNGNHDRKESISCLALKKLQNGSPPKGATGVPCGS